MDDDEITYQDLLEDEPGAAPASFAQLLLDGFPRNGGMAELAAIAQMPAPDERLARLRQGYQQLLEKQRLA